MQPYGLVIHGGAGTILRKNMPLELENGYRAKLKEALDAGYAVLESGKPAPDAVVAAVTVLEDSPLFNAGHGAVLNAEGRCESDAAIMDGRTLTAGAVAGLQHVRNPIMLARSVMESSPHVMLVGEGAEKFAREEGFETLRNSYFRTDRRQKELEIAKRLEETDPGALVSQGLQEQFHEGDTGSPDSTRSESKFGTVGCAALDRNGNLAAGTSTGGLTNKKYGRVGDSPIIGAGTYADNATCAVSCTGAGEFFIRIVAAHDVASQIRYCGRKLANAADLTLAKIRMIGGSGGLVAIDKEGNFALPFNTPGMYRAARISNGNEIVELYGNG